MNVDDPAGPPERSAALVATALVASGALLGGVLGFAVAGSRGTDLLPTALLGAALFAVPAIVAAALWIRAGALRVPTRTPYLPGDRFHGWTVVAHREEVPQFDEYEVRRGHRSAQLTVARTGDQWCPAANRVLLDIRSRHLAKPLQSGVARARPYLLLDRADGRPLTDLLDAPGTDGFVYEVAVSIMAALRDVHARDTTHGAVHPDNVLIGDRGVLLCAFDRSSIASADAVAAFPSVRDDVVGWAEVVQAVSTGRPFLGAFGEPVTPDDLVALPQWIRPVVADALAPVQSAADIVRNLTRAATAHGLSAETARIPRPAPTPKPAITRRAAVVSAATVAATVALLVAAPSKPAVTPVVSQPITTTPQPTTTTDSTTEQTTTTAPTTTTTTTTTTAAPPTVELRWTMPALIGSNLQDAQNRVQAETGNAVFLTSSHDASGAGRRQILDSDWRVCTQNVPPGAVITPTSKIDFGVVQYGESCP
jgi:hypothetical protein